MNEQLARIEWYYDAVPRAAARVEEVGPWTLFVGTGPLRFYGRPRRGIADGFTAGDVHDLLDRQRRLAVPQAIEWCADVAPSLADVVVAAGLTVHRYRLLVLEARRPVFAALPSGHRVRVLAPGDDDLAATEAAIGVGFSSPGTAIGPEGGTQRDAARRSVDVSRPSRQRIMADGLLCVVAASDRTGPVGGGSHAPRGGVTEITGVATLPSHRRRGLAAAVTAALVADARRRGVDLCFLSADSDDVARIYGRLGFVARYTACVAGPA